MCLNPWVQTRYAGGRPLRVSACSADTSLRPYGRTSVGAAWRSRPVKWNVNKAWRPLPSRRSPSPGSALAADCTDSSAQTGALCV
jgi:hypothetical protein